jgi:Domain of unknown function (DUF4105)
MKLKLSILILFLFSFFSNAQEQQLSSETEISVLTIGSGSSLNDAFGHSAFRIKDKTKYLDIVFNFGVYDFNTPNFYLKFAQGKLNYKLATNSYSDFFEFYIAQNRTVEEQILNLSQSEKLQLFDYLLNNAKLENRYYLYDFFYDNCATRIKDVINNSLDDHLMFNDPEGFTPKTFRQLIRSNLNQNSWGSLGIDVALGSVIDKTATAEEHMFLPKFIYTFFETATFSNSGKPLVKQSRVLFKKRDKLISTSFLTSPLMVFGIIGLIILIITYCDYKNAERSKWLDITLFTITSLIGVFVLLLWFATDHSTTANNYNLLWAFPINLFVISQLYKKLPKKWFIKYLKFLIILLSLMILHWIIGIQVFAVGLIPLLFALLVRYIFLVNYFSKKV